MFPLITFNVFPHHDTGLIVSLPFLGQPPDQNCYDDSVYWEVGHISNHREELHCGNIYTFFPTRMSVSFQFLSHRITFYHLFLRIDSRFCFAEWRIEKIESCLC